MALKLDYERKAPPYRPKVKKVTPRSSLYWCSLVLTTLTSLIVLFQLFLTMIHSVCYLHPAVALAFAASVMTLLCTADH